MIWEYFWDENVKNGVQRGVWSAPGLLSIFHPSHFYLSSLSKPHFGHCRSFLFMSAFHNAFEAFLASPEDGVVGGRPPGGLTVTNPSPEAEISTTPLRKSTRTRRRRKFESSSSSGGSDSVSTEPQQPLCFPDLFYFSFEVFPLPSLL